MYKVSYLFVFSVLLGCNSPQEKTFTAKHIVDINNPAEISIDDFVTDIDTIRLETTDESIMHDIMYFHIMDDKIYIFTYDHNNPICIFDLKGKFISKISDKGQGPNEYNSISFFEVDRVKKRIIITDTYLRKIFVYDKDGKQIEVIQLDFEPSRIVPYRAGFINVYSGGHKYSNPEWENYNIHFLDSKGKFISSAIERETLNRIDMYSPNSVHTLDNGDILFHPPLGDIVYKIGPDNMIESYYEFNNLSKLKFLSKEEKKDFEYSTAPGVTRNTVKEKEDEGYLLSFGSVYDLTDCVFFAFSGWEKRHFLYYDKKTSRTILIDHATVKGNSYLISALLWYPRSVHDNKFYVSISPTPGMEEMRDGISNEKVKTLLEKTEFDSNPVIISFSVKIP